MVSRKLRLSVGILFGCLCAVEISVALSPHVRPRIAVVIDDFGLTYPKNVPDANWMKLPWPLTFAIMPKSPRTKTAAAEAKAAGKEILIHFPFDPFVHLELPPGEKPSQKDLLQVRALLQKSVDSIPGAVGLNNHRSYQATQNRALMRAFMSELKARGLYFLDSRVSARTVAYEEALRAFVPAAINDVFLDEAKRHDKEFCKRMLRRAAAIARRKGFAVAIGHHYFHGTYQGLVEMIPELEKEGFEFVSVSQVVSIRP